MSEQIQSILIPKSKYSLKDSIRWIEDNGFKIDKIPRVTSKYYRFRQEAPDYVKYHYITKHIGDLGIDIIIGYPIGEVNGKGVISKVGNFLYDRITHKQER